MLLEIDQPWVFFQVITRNRDSSILPWTIKPGNGKWFLVETNYDHWLPDPLWDNRRTYAIKAVLQMGQNFGPLDLMNALSYFPVMNNGTIMTSVMLPSQPSLMWAFTRSRYPPWPPMVMTTTAKPGSSPVVSSFLPSSTTKAKPGSSSVVPSFLLSSTTVQVKSTTNSGSKIVAVYMTSILLGIVLAMWNKIFQS